MKSIGILAALAAVQLLVGCVDQGESKPSAEQTDAFERSVTALLEDYSESTGFMGSVVVLEAGLSVFSGSVGEADTAASLTNDPNTRYRIGSVSKIYTAAMVFKAIEQGRLALDSHLSEFFPTIPQAQSITIAHLLQHRSGIASYTRDPSFWNYHVEGIPSDDLLAIIEGLPREFAAGSDARYSNSNYFLLARILELIHERDYAGLLQDEIAGPFELTGTSHPADTLARPGEALSYERDDKGWSEMPTTHPSAALGGGSLVTTAGDLARFLHLLMDGAIVSADSLQMMKDQRDGHGMGLQRLSVGARTGFGHGGQVDGFESIAVAFPEDDVVFVILANGTTERVAGLLARIGEAYFGSEEQPLSEEDANRYAGTFVSNSDSSSSFRFIAKDGALVLLVMNEFEEPLTHTGNGRFLFEQLYAPSMLFTFADDGQSVTMKQAEFEGSYSRELDDRQDQG